MFSKNNGKDTQIEYLEDEGLVLVVQSNGKHLALVDIETGETVDSVELAEEAFKKNYLEVAEIQDKDTVVVASRSNGREESQVSTIRLNLDNQELTQKDLLQLDDTKLK